MAKVVSPIYAEDEAVPAKTNLWAGISVTEPLLREGRLKSFQVSFALVNSAQNPIDPKVGSWELNINGTDHPDSQFMFQNGPRDKRWELLPPGESLLFGYACGDFFKSPAKYAVYWHGDGFRSAPVDFWVLDQKESEQSVPGYPPQGVGSPEP